MELQMPRSELEVVGKTFTHEYGNSSPRYSAKTTMPFLRVIAKFPTFPIHKISITLLQILICLGGSCSLQMQKYERQSNIIIFSRFFVDIFNQYFIKQKKHLITVKILMTKFTEK